jgi:hypothetical protein
MSFSPIFPDTGYLTPVTKPAGMKHAARWLQRTPIKRALSLALSGAVVTGTASATKSQAGVGAGTTIGSGLVNIETYTFVNRATVAADENELEANLLANPVGQATGYPENLNGNPLGTPGMR